MDNVFGIGLPELVLILVIAGMVMGPERIARSARTLGALTARLQTISRSFIRQMNAELDAADETGQLKSTVAELDQLRRQVADLRNEVFTLATGTAAESKQVVRDLKHEVGNSILPPDLAPGKKSLKALATPGDRGTVYRPPSLHTDGPAVAETGANGNGSPNPTIMRPPVLPKRVDVSEDPDA